MISDFPLFYAAQIKKKQHYFRTTLKIKQPICCTNLFDYNLSQENVLALNCRFKEKCFKT